MFACLVDTDPYFHRTFQNSLEVDFSDYGFIFDDAKQRSCSGGATNPKGGAYQALLDKVNNTLDVASHPTIGGVNVGPYSGWLEGADVTLIFSTALQIGGHGDLDTTLDQVLATGRPSDGKSVRDSYHFYRDPNCGFSATSGWNDQSGYNTCMDDHAVAASAWAWIAAYEHHRGRDATTYINNAKTELHASFQLGESICLFDPSRGLTTSYGPCNVTNKADVYGLLSNLGRGGEVSAETISMNHNGQNIVYGAGLLSSINSAMIALDEAGASIDFPDGDEKLIAMALLEEAQRKTDSNGNYFKGETGGTPDCATFSVNGTNVTRTNAHSCADNGEVPQSYGIGAQWWRDGVSGFIERYIQYPIKSTVYDFGVGQSAFQFNLFNPNNFTDNYNLTKLHWARKQYYGNLGFLWNKIVTDPGGTSEPHTATEPDAGENRGRLSGLINDQHPIGYFDGIDANGIAQGWTCDKDAPSFSNYVDFYVNGFGSFILRVRADQGNEQAVTDLCTAGYYHRFYVQMPSWTKGQPIYAYGLDSSWRGFTNLPGYACAQYPACSW